MALTGKWRSPIIWSSLLALTISTLLQGLDITFESSPWAFYLVVTISLASLLIYNYIGGVRIEEHETDWLSGLRYPHVEKLWRGLVLVAVQSLFGVMVLLFDSHKIAIGYSLITLSLMYIVWDILIRFLGRSLGNIRQTFYRFIPWDLLVLLAAITMYAGSTTDDINFVILSVTGGEAMILVSITLTFRFQENLADWCTRQSWLP